MRRLSRTIMLWIAAAAAALIASAAPAAEHQVTTSSANQDYPSIWGDIIVWHDDRNGHSDIYGYDLGSGQEFRITTDGANQFYPDVSANIVTWDDFRNGTWDIYYYNLATQTEGFVVVDPAGQSGSACSGFKVVWSDTRAATADIYYRDVDAGSGKAICTYGNHQTWPDISGDLIVWQDKRAGLYNIDIWGYSLASSQEFQVTTDASNQEAPAISGQRVVWQDKRNGDYDIYMRDLSSGAEVPICTAPGDQTEPAIDGEKIVWTDMRDGNPDIYLFDLATLQEFPVCTDLAEQRHPAIWGNRVVWADNRNGNWDVYCMDVGDPEPPSVNITSPPDASTLHDTISVTASAGDNQGVARVEFSLDGSLAHSDFTEPYAWLWNTVGTTDGPHVISAKAFDASENFAENVINVWVDNAPPAVTINAPTAGSWVSGSRTVTAEALDSVGVARVEFSIDGALKYTDAASPYSWAWNTLAATNGAHTLRATAYDRADHSAYHEIAVSVDNTTPSVQLTQPADGATLKGNVAAAATASDTVSGLASVKFYVDGVLKQTCASPPYEWQWDTAQAPDGWHVIAAQASDLAGNQAWDSRNVFIDNVTFDDVPKTRPDWAYIEALVREGITGGCSATPPLYCPEATLTRQQMAVFIVRAMGQSPYDNPTPTFSDVPKGSPYYGYIERMYQLGITGGCATSPLRYCPTAPITRRQMAVFLCRAAGLTPYDKATPTFADVPKSDSACGYIERMVEQGITGGCAPSPPRYCPDSAVTRAQMAVFIVRAFHIPL